MRMAQFFRILAFYAFTVLASAGAYAQTGSGTTRILLGFADDAGYSFAQLISENIATAMGQPVVIERRPGATGRIAAEALKNARPDGSTLYLAPMVVPVLAPLVFRNLTYDPVKDFAPVAQVLTFRYALAVSADHPAKTGKEFIAWAKAHPKEASYGTAGAGGAPHFVGVMINEATGTQLLHVPYKGGAPMLADLMGGQIAAGVESLTNLIGAHRAGKVRILAVSGTERSPIAPSIPTFQEEGLTTNDVVGWVGVFAPAGTPKVIVDRLSATIVEAVHAPTIRDKYLRLGVEPTGTTPEELAAIMAADTARWAPIIKASGFSAD
jgi:tripartite-type tricarboxylate transporter receptor subunit TctC